jgi:general secretion pathway protein H
MPISAPGRTERGLTLVELLVVLLIIGMTTGLTVLALPRSDSDLAAIAQRLERDIAALRDDAVAQGRFYGITAEPGRIRRVTARDGEWQVLDEQRLPPGFAVELRAEEGWQLPEHRDTLLFTPPQEETEEDSVKLPPIRFAPDGSVTPFSVTLRQGRAQAILRIGADGRFRTEGIE